MVSLLDFFFSPARPLALGVNVAILALAIWAAYRLLEGLRRIRVEAVGLATLREKLREAESAEQIQAVVPHLPPNSMVQRRVATLWTLKRAGDDIDHEALAALAQAELEDQTVLGRWASSAVVLIGFAGTLLGLTLAVREADVVLRSLGGTDIQRAVEAVIKTFDGIQVAFSTTLMGVAWSVLLGLLVTATTRRQSAFLSDLEDLTQTRLIPQFRTSAGVALVKAANKLTEMEEHFEGALREVIDQLHTRGIALTTTVDKSFQQLTDDFKSRTSELLTRFDATYEGLSKIIGSPSEDAATIADSLARLKEAVAGIERATETTMRTVPQLQEAIASQIDQQTTDIHDALNAYTSRLSDSVERQEAAIDGGMESLNSTLDELGPAVAEVMRRATASQIEALDRLSKELESLVKRLTEQSTVADGHMKAGAEAAQRLVADVGTVRELAASADRALQLIARRQSGDGPAPGTSGLSQPPPPGAPPTGAPPMPDPGGGPGAEKPKAKSLFERLFGKG